MYGDSSLQPKDFGLSLWWGLLHWQVGIYTEYPTETQRKVTQLLRQNDASTSFWRNDDVVIALCVRWASKVSGAWISENRLQQSVGNNYITMPHTPVADIRVLVRDWRIQWTGSLQRHQKLTQDSSHIRHHRPGTPFTNRVCQTGIRIWTWISNYIHAKQYNVLTHGIPNFSSDLVKPLFKLWHGWVITYHIKQWMWLFMHVM